MNRLIRGGLAGLTATGAMSLLLAAGQAAGLHRPPAPEHIVDRLERKLGIRHELSTMEFASSWMLAHAGYGSANGAIFALVRGLLPRSPVLAGLIFGGGLWTFGYLGLTPALDLYPPPDRDAPEHQATIIAGHAVYGVTLGLAYQWLRGGTRRTA